MQGASQETGTRILTSRLHLNESDIDAEDFHDITLRDVPISTAIHNGARFPWISPAGLLTRTSGEGKVEPQGHIVDGGYFDAAGVGTIRELARAINRKKERGDNIRFVYVLIGYEGAIEAALKDDAAATPSWRQWLWSWLPGGGAEDQERETHTIVNEVVAPLRAMMRSRAAHGKHLMGELKSTGAGQSGSDANPYGISISDSAAYVPIILCDEYRGAERTLGVPMNWTLSQSVQDYIRDATGYGPKNLRGCNSAREGLDAAVKLISEPDGWDEVMSAVAKPPGG